MAITLLHVDAFADEPFSGNPAAVCLLPPPSGDDWKEKLAAEMNLAETAFVERARKPDPPATAARAPLPEEHIFSLRWFTPMAEVPLCGHATLASAHALWEEGLVPREAEIAFETLSGRLRATVTPGADGERDAISLDFPAMVATEQRMPDGLESALGARVVHFAESATKLLVELESEAAVRELQPNFQLLQGLPKEGVIVTARGDSAPQGGRERFDFVSRFFAPKLGINEDPVTGSSHSVLAPWWQTKLGRSEFRARQLSARGGSLTVRLRGERVFLCGHAVTVARGELLAGPS